MNIQQLEYIIAVDNYRHFSKAAEASFVTQPTLSMMIQKLEEELGVKIFDRSQLPVHPTEIGKRIIDQARVAVAQVNQIKEVVQEEKGIIRVFSGWESFQPYLPSPPRLMQVHSENKYDIRIVISELTTDHILKGLSNDSLDGGILATPLREPSIRENPIYYERFYAYVSPQERALFAKTSLDESDLTAARLWLLDEVHCFRTQILHLCNLRKKKGGNQQSIFSYEAGSIDTLINIVDKNDGLTVIPEMALANLSEAQMKNVRPFKNSTPVREVSLVTRKEFYRERLLNIILDEVKTAVRVQCRTRQ